MAALILLADRPATAFAAPVAPVGSALVSELADELRGHVSDLHVIGDAHIPQTVEEATFEGARLGRAL